jgi:hypothetical protein
MSFVRAQRALSGCSCEQRGPVRAYGLGDTAAGWVDPKVVMSLEMQLNRYGSRAPVGFQFVPVPVPVDGLLSTNDAARAVTILQWRYQRATEAFPGESDAAIMLLKQVTSAEAVKDPVGYVSKDVAGIASLLQKYADAHGLPEAGSNIITTMLSSLSADPKGLVMVGAAALAAIFWVTR